ncbi:hypothetical protein [Fibrella forsythiae]|uniref:Phage protein n=1 Tax=Fibrella forsythiae TaxID=2817061 RepID=A0ABS3JTA3_9BACT|nr:hypothetical protein [Fibrella forsythiae]MBO0953244.1 hypothetical protein [Fibrella forsythiae]
MAKESNFIDFNDEKIPVGKRKQAYVRWAMSKGTSAIDAKRQANKKFGFEKRGKAFVIFQYDTDLLWQHKSQILFQVGAHRYEEFEYTTDDQVTPEKIAYYKAKGFEIKYQPLAR